MKIDIEWLREQMGKVPFGNSWFQNSYFTDGQESPERRWRHILLQLSKKVEALKACEFRRRRIDLDLEDIEVEMEVMIEKDRDAAESRDYARKIIDKEEKEWQLASEVQLIADAMVEVETYMAMIKDLPPLEDREQFERAEHGYWQQRLMDDLRRDMIEKKTVGIGTQKALEQIGIDVRVDPQTKQLVHINQRVEAIRNDILHKRKTHQISQGNNIPEAIT